MAFDTAPLPLGPFYPKGLFHSALNTLSYSSEETNFNINTGEGLEERKQQKQHP